MSSLKATYNTKWIKAGWLLGGFIIFNTNVTAKADNDEWDSDTESGFQKRQKD